MRSIRHSASTSISLTLRSAIPSPRFSLLSLPAFSRLMPASSAAAPSTSGHSPAVMLYITVSRTVPSRRRA